MRASSPRSQGDGRGEFSPTQSATRNGQSHDETDGSLAPSVGIAVLTGTLGVAGGVLLARTALQRRRKIVGIPVPSDVGIDLAGVTQRIGRAGRQFGKLAGEVRTARERTERIGSAFG